jgi:hypothetical protein
MGNFASAGGGAGKIVLPDGTVRALGEPVSVAELMVEHPCHFVVDARVISTVGGAKVAALPADDVLHGAGVYVVLPAARGRVSADEVRRVLAAASRPLPRSGSMQAGGQEQRDEAAAKLEGLGGRRPEFLTREMTSSGPWKPSLRTIEELSLPRKVPHWLF